MESASKSLVIFAVLGIVTSIYWSVYVFFPNNDFIIKLGLALNAAWVIGYILVLASITGLGVHLYHRSRS